MQKVEFEDAAISEEIFRELRQEPPYVPADLEEISRLILSKRMWGHEFQTLSDLRHLTGLRSLKLKNVCGVDFAPVFEYPNLTRLVIQKCDLSRLEGLQNLAQLEDLAVSWNFIEDFTPLLQLGDEPAAVAPSFDLAEHRVVMGPDEAGGHLADCELDEELRENLEALVADLSEAEFVREDDAYLNYWEVSNQAKFPMWYRQLRKALALPVVAGSHPDRARITFDHPKIRGESYVLSPPGVHLKSMRRKLVDEAGALPIAHETHRLLVIRLGSDDQTIYELDPSVYQPKEPFHAFDSPVFANPAQMFDVIATVRTTR